MILDHLDRLDDYRDVHPHFGPIFDHVRTLDLRGHAEGRHELPNGAVLIVEVHEEGPGGLGTLETHQKFIDLQIGIEGLFKIGWKERRLCEKPEGEYDAERDVRFYDDLADFYFPVRAGVFTLLFPDDAHAPAPCEQFCKKAVVKIPVG